MALVEPSKNVFDPAKNYSRVRFIGDRDFQDFEGIELQQILDDERRRLFDRVFVEGAIVQEAGGTIGPARQGVKVGNVAAVSSGSFKGFITQVYTLKVLIGGAAGEAVISVSSNGEDNGVENTGYEFTIAAGDLLNGTTQYDVGVRGVKIAFIDNKAVKNFVEADSWTVLVTHGRQLPTINGNQLTPSTIAIYVEGRLVFVPTATLTFPTATTGSSIVYAEVLADIMTGDGDPEIKAAFTNLNTAERERITATYKTTDDSDTALPPSALWRRVYPVYLWNRATDKVERAVNRPIAFSLNDVPGQLLASALADVDFSEELRGILAELVEDITGGSYRVNGLRARKSTNAAPAGKTLITIESGKARISGLRIVKDEEEDIEIDLATETALVSDEAKTFSTGVDTYSLNKAVGADKLPVQAVQALTAIVEVTRQLTKGTANGLDVLPDQPVQSIIEVKQGGTTYATPADYVQNGNFVDWSPGGIEPVNGTSYDVKYRYTKQMVLTSDFILIDADGDGDLDTVDFSPGGDNPVDGSVFFVDYTYFMPRIDLIFLRTDRTFAVVKGVAAEAPVAPQQPTQFLGIARIQLGPNSASNVVIEDLDNYLVTMATVRDAIKRQEDQRLNDALQSLLNQTKLRETAAFKAVFADAFSSEEMADPTFSRPAGAGGVSPGTQITYDALLDLFEFELTLPITTAIHALTKNDALVPGGSVISATNRDFVTLPFTEVLEIDQDQYSEERNVNPFLAFGGPAASIRLLPDRDDGFVELVNTELVDTWIAVRGRLRRPLNEVQVERKLRRRRWANNRSVIELRRIVSERAGLYMREIAIQVNGENFAAGEDNIALSFDGKTVVLTATGGTESGTLGGTVKANSSGAWQGEFVIPPQVRVGTRNAIATGPTSQAMAQYTGDMIERTITIFQRALFNRPFVDPLAQTFAFSQPTTLTRATVYFARKSVSTDSPLNCELRDVETPGGFPGRSVFEQIVKQWSDIAEGQNSFAFGNPMFVPANTYRALTLLSESKNYFVHSASGGREGFNPAGWITLNPNTRGSEPAGILLESLNALNWEPHSQSAVRYRLYRAEFQSQSTIYFDRISGVSYSQLFLSTDQVVPEQTNIQWQVSTDGLAIGGVGKVWRDIVPYELLDLAAVITDIDVRAILSTEDTRVTPYVNFKNWLLQGFLYKDAGKYISATNATLQDIASIKIYVEVQIPSVGDVDWFVSNAEDASDQPIWEAATVIDADVDLGDGFREQIISLTFNNAIPQKQSFRKLRVRADLATTNQAFTPRVQALAATFI